MARPGHRTSRVLLLAVAFTLLLGAATSSAAVPTLPDTSRLTVSALRDCRPATRPADPLPAVDPHGVNPASPNPLSGLTFFVNPSEPAWEKWHSYQRSGDSRDAALMWKIASTPRFTWFGRFTRPRFRIKVRNWLNCVHALQPGAVPEMTVLRAQAKSCGGGYTGGDQAEDARTRAWYRDFADVIGTDRVVLAYEPDSLGTLDCQTRKRRTARIKLLRYGVDVLSKLPNATIYIEAGASDWEPAKRTARLLKKVGIRKVRGFMLNATHYDWTANNLRYGRKVSRLTGGKHFIISTAFNGRGPVHIKKRLGRHKYRMLNLWCHPLYRGAGPYPTTNTGDSKADAFLWIGRPGYSGGACNGGPLPVGKFWPERALMLAQNQTELLRPPSGSHYGWDRLFSLRQLGFCGDGPCR